MAYNEILDSEVQPEAPITSSLGFRFRDNPLSVAAREVGAPHMAPPRIVVLAAGTSGNWTVPDDCYGIRVTCVGGGGGATRSTVQSTVGGAAGVAIATLLDLTPGSTIAYSVGAGGASFVSGGNTTFGSITAAGGSEGTSIGAGGTASGGDINLDGEDGYYVNGFGFGGSTMFGRGGKAQKPGHGYGAGAAAAGSGSLLKLKGGDGVIIIEY